MADEGASDHEESSYHIKKHGRTSSSDQAIPKSSAMSTVVKPIEEHEDDVPAITSPSRTKSRMSERPKTKRQKSSASTTSHKTNRPTYSRRYSTPPSRPLSPSGYPQLLESDGVIPEIDLNQTTSQLHRHQIQQQQHQQQRPHQPMQHQQQPQYQPIQQMQQHQPPQFFDLSVDTAPQEPDIWDDPETDYFSTIEGPSTKHGRAKSRRQVSQNLNGVVQQSMAAKGLQQISEDAEFLLPPTPGAFAA